MHFLNIENNIEELQKSMFFCFFRTTKSFFQRKVSELSNKAKGKTYHIRSTLWVFILSLRQRMDLFLCGIRGQHSWSNSSQISRWVTRYTVVRLNDNKDAPSLMQQYKLTISRLLFPGKSLWSVWELRWKYQERFYHQKQRSCGWRPWVRKQLESVT